MIIRRRKKTRQSVQWATLLDIDLWAGTIIKDYTIAVLDPDGWDRSSLHVSFGEQVTYEEFKRRLGRSTCEFRNQKKHDQLEKEMLKCGLNLENYV